MTGLPKFLRLSIPIMLRRYLEELSQDIQPRSCPGPPSLAQVHGLLLSFVRQANLVVSKLSWKKCGAAHWPTTRRECVKLSVLRRCPGHHSKGYGGILRGKNSWFKIVQEKLLFTWIFIQHFLPIVVCLLQAFFYGAKNMCHQQGRKNESPMGSVKPLSEESLKEFLLRQVYLCSKSVVEICYYGFLINKVHRKGRPAGGVTEGTEEVWRQFATCSRLRSPQIGLIFSLGKYINFFIIKFLLVSFQRSLVFSFSLKRRNG